MKNAMQLKAIMKKLAKENQISAQLVLQNYMLERFLERVSLSPYRDNYIIKGGFLISSMVGLNSRATMDMDATIKGYPVTQDTVRTVSCVFVLILQKLTKSCSPTKYFAPARIASTSIGNDTNVQYLVFNGFGTAALYI